MGDIWEDRYYSLWLFLQQYRDLSDASSSQDAERVRIVLFLEYSFFRRKDIKGTETMWSTCILCDVKHLILLQFCNVNTKNKIQTSHPNSALFQGKIVMNIYLKLLIVWENIL